MSTTLKHLELTYGKQQSCNLAFTPDCLAGHFALPLPMTDVRTAVDEALQQPLNFPPVYQAIVPGDKITLAVDGNVPEIGPILDGLWRQFEERQIRPGDVTILQSPQKAMGDPRSRTREPACKQFQYVIHDPKDENSVGYLATSAAGERVYLSRLLTNADFVLTIGAIRFDDEFGFAGTNSSLYPAMSAEEEITKHIGRGHLELTPSDDRPLRSMADEVGWLLGIQFTVQVIAGAGGGITHVLAGCNESVFRTGRELLAGQSECHLDDRSETVVATVDAVNGKTSWGDVVNAIDAARRVVERDGRIVVLSSVGGDVPEKFEQIVTADFPSDAQQPVWNPKTVESPMAAKLLQAVDWARVFLLSDCKDELVEDLFMIPVNSESEVQKLLNSVREFSVLESAQSVYATVDA